MTSFYFIFYMYRWTYYFLFLKIFYLFIFRRGRERKTEMSLCGCLSSAPYWEPGPPPTHVPWLGIQTATNGWQVDTHSIEPHQSALHLLIFDGTINHSQNVSDKFLGFLLACQAISFKLNFQSWEKKRRKNV